MQTSTSPSWPRGATQFPKDSAVDELRRFRHKLRHRYDVTIEVDQLHPVIKNAVASWPRLRAHLAAFAGFVDQCLEVAE
jgi:ribonuclease HepT-like protein